MMMINYEVKKTETKRIEFDLEDFINSHIRNWHTEDYDHAYARLLRDGYEWEELQSYVCSFIDSEFIYDTFASDEAYEDAYNTIFSYFSNELKSMGIREI